MVAIHEKGGHLFYIVSRMIIGILFFLHGLMKFFGEGFNLTSQSGIAAIIELAVGLLVFAGMFSLIAYIIGAVEMAYAFFVIHLPQGFNPLTNGGEPALLFFAAFLALLAYHMKHAEFDTHSFTRLFRR